MKRRHEGTEARRHGVGRGSRGFTLIEVIVIIVILGVLATVIAPRILSRIGQSKQSVAASNASTLVSQVRILMADAGGSIPEGETIDILWERPSFADEGMWHGPYVDTQNQLVDPWGNRYVLEAPGRNGAEVSVVSLGADGRPGGEGENADVVKP
jgi:general secretion pathway protein G